ncbi:MAG TPA: hypothetical protein VGW10_07525 [Solirubrobacteraceae bacterium]|nr:hypothetical protein [Solirubrobacteraceae bacterium]
MRSTLAVSALIALFASAATAEAKTYDVDDVLGDDIARVAPLTDVPIRLPARISLGYDDAVFGDGGLERPDGYSFTLAAAPDCGNATACFLAQFSGQENGSFAFRRRVRLARGIVGRYKPTTCGASCSPPMIEWKQRGRYYSLQAKVAGPERRLMVRAANSAIRSTPR